MGANAEADSVEVRSPPVRVSAWAPLRITIFRALFAAQLGSNIGNWMETVGAQWLLVDHPNAATLVSLVQTADMLPFMFLALPAGVLADVFDRRRYLIFVHLFLTAASGFMAAATLAGSMRPSLLLALTFLEGAGSALAMPAWQAIIPELVPREQLPAAAALAGINQNLARSIGPALAGVLVARIGAGWVFAINAATFLLGIAVMLAWKKPEAPVDALGREDVIDALRAGARYIRHSKVVRRLLLRTTLFVVPATALWALLPLVASRALGLGPSGYGLLLGSLGIGAILGALVLPRLIEAVSRSTLIFGASVVYAAALVVAGVVPNAALVILFLMGAGASWMSMLVRMSASLQLFLPVWVRARGLATYQLTLMGGQAVAAAAWGLVAEHFGLGFALVAAAGCLGIGGATVFYWPVYEVEGLDRTPQSYWPLPELRLLPANDDGPVLVTAHYLVSEANVAEFLSAMDAVSRSRRRTGAVRWELFRDGMRPERFVELFVVGSWGEHLRQHGGRLTPSDREAEERARRFADGPVMIEHFLPPTTPRAT